MAALLAVSAVAVASNEEHSSSSGRVAKPVHAEGKGDKCVRDTAYMRRHHMEELKHHRNETLRKGIRTTEFSLQACIECHADKKTNSVLGKEGFCQSCHAYAAVKLDCFECHASKPKAAKPGALGEKEMKSSISADVAKQTQQDMPAVSVENNSTGGVSK